MILFSIFFPCWFTPSFSVWCVPISHVHSAAAHGFVVGFPLLVFRVVPGLGSIGTVVAFSQFVSACEAIYVWLTPRWPFFIIFGRLGGVAGLIAVSVAAALR